MQNEIQEGTLQDASGMNVVEAGTHLAAGANFFTPAEAVGTSSSSLSAVQSTTVLSYAS